MNTRPATTISFATPSATWTLTTPGAWIAGAFVPGDGKLRDPVDYLVPAFKRLAAACREYHEAWL